MQPAELLFKGGELLYEKHMKCQNSQLRLLVMTLVWIGRLLAVGPPLAPPPLTVITVKLYCRPGNIPPTIRLVRRVCAMDKGSSGAHCKVKLSQSPEAGPDHNSSMELLVGPCLTDRSVGGSGAERIKQHNLSLKLSESIHTCSF